MTFNFKLLRISGSTLTSVMFAFMLTMGALPITHATNIPLSSAPFFSSDSEFKAELSAPFAELFSQRQNRKSAKAIRIDGVLRIANESIPVQIRMRGNSTLAMCSFPKLALKLPKDLPSNSVLAGLRKLDLGTHCAPENPSDRNYLSAMEHNSREVLIYKWQRLLGIPALAARAGQMTYVDTSGASAGASVNASSPIKPLETLTKSALLLEHLDHFLDRSGGTEIRTRAEGRIETDPKPSDRHKFEYVYWREHPQMNFQQLAILELFVGMIGDFDHRLDTQIWNYKIIEIPGGEWFPILNDFNLAQIAMGTPFPGLGVSKARFLSRPANERLEVLRHFKAKFPELAASTADLGHDPQGKEAFLKTLEFQQTNFSNLITDAERELAATP